MSKYSVVLAISLVFSSAYAEQQVVRDSGTYVFRGVTKKVVRLESGANTVTLGGANGHCVARTFGELFGCDDEMDGRFVGAEIYAETWEVDDWPFHLASGVHKDSYNTRWIDSETDEDITDLLLPAGYFDVEMEITIAGGSDPVTHQAFDFEIPVIYDEYKDHGEGTFNINPEGGPDGFYIGNTNLSTHINSKIENELEEYWCKWDNTVLQGNSTNWIPTNWPASNIRCFVYIGASSDSTHSNVCIALPQWEPNEPRKLDFLVTKAAKCTNLVFKVAEGPATSSSYNFITYTTASTKYGWLELSYHPGVGWLSLPHTVAGHYFSTNGFRRTTVAGMPSTWLPSGTGEGVLKFNPVPGGSVPEWEPPPPE